ncbi:MAG: ATP-binding protein [Clostridia bacterium]|nr:ATP-binding protein [Clostridia bacterium]
MISRIKWKNHNVLGNLELDFKKSDGTIYNTIILAGDNGTGKTTILNTLAEFLNLGSIEPFNFIDYSVGKSRFKARNNDNLARLGFHERINEKTKQSTIIHTNRNNDMDRLENDKDDIRYYGYAYSKARTGFVTQKVKTSQTEQLDMNKYEEDVDNSNDFTSIKQLIVDIDTQDNAEWMNISRGPNPIKIETFNRKSRMYRFRNAFNDFFDKMKFDKVDNLNTDEKKIIFKKNGKEIEIDDLSTGEKQIVFRGAYLLKNVNGINNGIVLIDEPELSLHPKWQEKILEYYRRMFRKNGVQSVQIIIATHSEYLIKSAIDNKDDILIIALKDDNGTIKVNKINTPCVLPTMSAAEINYVVFGVISTDYHNQLYGYLQVKNNKRTVKSMDEYIVNQSGIFEHKYEKQSSNGNTKYQTISTYVRNMIDHPPAVRPFTDTELKLSIEFLVKLCKLP